MKNIKCLKCGIRLSQHDSLDAHIEVCGGMDDGESERATFEDTFEVTCTECDYTQPYNDICVECGCSL